LAGLAPVRVWIVVFQGFPVRVELEVDLDLSAPGEPLSSSALSRRNVATHSAFGWPNVMRS
jgi:hypothetical protein